MAAVHVDPARVREFETAEAFYRWLAEHHDSADEVWIRIHKLSSGLASITPKEAIDVVLCWGWIDGIRKSLDDKSYLQRYTPRRARSMWSQVNVENVARLVAEGRMTEHGMAQVDAARADGRWGRAYGRAADMPLPDDLLAAVDAEPRAKAMLATLTAQNRFALAFHLHAMKTDPGRRKKIDSFVAMLKRGETIHPQGKDRKGSLEVSENRAGRSASANRPFNARAGEEKQFIPGTYPARRRSGPSALRAAPAGLLRRGDDMGRRQAGIARAAFASLQHQHAHLFGRRTRMADHHLHHRIVEQFVQCGYSVVHRRPPGTVPPRHR